MKSCYICGSARQEHILDIRRKPDCEVDYGIPEEKYFREVFRCIKCGVYNNFHNLIDEKNFYSGHYNLSISNDLQKRFEKIISIADEKSDNKQRVKRIMQFINSDKTSGRPKKILDVGSGTCVFLYELKNNFEIEAYCVDPDPLAIEHAKRNVSLKEAYVGTIFDIDFKNKFDVITFNKVLEHVKNPLDILSHAQSLLNEDGFIYIELPESDRIFNSNAIDKRAEFALEHYSIYNEKSMNYMAKALNMDLIDFETITDPSGKFTIYGFMKISK